LTNSLNKLQGIYYLASNLAHSCVPNAIQTFTKEGQIVVRAAVPISKGSKITINHVSVPFYGTIPRQIDLENTRFITCSCQRCSDPTELGTFTSGIYCSKCPNQEGLLLPENPLVKLTEWVCNKCSDRKTEASIFEVMVDIEEDYGRLDKPFNRTVVGKCEAFIRKYDKMLHPNHYYLVGAKRYLCHTYGGSNPFDNTKSKLISFLKMLTILCKYFILFKIKFRSSSPKEGSHLQGRSQSFGCDFARYI